MMKHAAATLGSGNLRMAVQLPEGEELNEWVAVNSEWIKVFLRQISHTDHGTQQRGNLIPMSLGEHGPMLAYVLRLCWTKWRPNLREHVFISAK